MPPSLDHPRRRRMEPMVVSRRKVDDHKEQLVTGLQLWQTLALDRFSRRRLLIHRRRRHVARLLGKRLRTHADHHLRIMRHLGWQVLFDGNVFRRARMRRHGGGFVALLGLFLDLDQLVRRTEERGEGVADVVDFGEFLVYPSRRGD